MFNSCADTTTPTVDQRQGALLKWWAVATECLQPTEAATTLSLTSFGEAEALSTPEMPASALVYRIDPRGASRVGQGHDLLSP